MRTTINWLLVCLVVIGLAAGNARANTTNTWTNTGGGDWSTAGNWNPGIPTSAGFVYFTNNSSGYTVTFTNNPTIWQLNILNDRVTFDLQGHTLTNYPFNSTPTAGYITNATVTFGSTGPLGTVRDITWQNDHPYIDGASTVVTISNVAFYATSYEAHIGGGATLNVFGAGARFDTVVGAGGLVDHLGGQVNVLNGAEATLGYVKGNGGAASTIIVSNNSWLVTNPSTALTDLIGYTHPTQIKLYNNSSWATPVSLYLGQNDVGNNTNRSYFGDIILDNSTLYGQSATIGEGTAGVRHNGEIVLQNNSLGVFSNGWIRIANFTSAYGAVWTNRLVIDHSTVMLGDATHSGVITNYGLLQASGTITGRGPGNFLLLNGNLSGTGGVFVVGNSIGTLTLNRGNLQQAAGSRTYWEISDTGVDTILARDGFASMLGSNIWTWLGPAPVHGVKYGLGTYDFLVASNITWNPQYDNLVNILTNTYHLTYGVDFVYGVHNLGGGLFALELAFVPEPSTVLLLALGGLLVWRRIAKRGRRLPGKTVTALVLSLALLALAGGRAQAAVSSWTNTAGGVWNTAGNWNPGAPGASDFGLFTNNQSTAYTVTFNANVNDAALVVTNDKVIFDLAGRALTNNFYGLGQAYLGQDGAPATVTITSSSNTPGIVQYNHLGYPYRLAINGAGTVVTVTNASLAATEGRVGVGATVNVLGPNARFSMPVGAGGNSDHLGGTVNVLNGGAASLGYVKGGAGGETLIVVSNGSSLATTPAGGGADIIGYLWATKMRLYQNSTWTTPLNLDLSYNDVCYTAFTVPYYADIVLDNSTFYGQGAKIGQGYNPGYYTRGNGEIVIRNGSTATFSNGWILVNNFNYSLYGYLWTNQLVLANSTIHLGDATHSGAITNYGLIQASGTITGHGPGNFLLLNGNIGGTGGVFNVGNSIGTLTLNRGNLQLAAGSRSYWEISDTGVDSILARDGFASVLGSNIWTWLGPAPVHGVKYGLGTYDFLVASNITWNPQYDNLVNILTNTYHLTYNVDFVYGVHNLGGGLFALELAFVPEPSTVMLLALGGLLVWRRIAKRGRRLPGKTVTALVLSVALLALAGGSTQAAVSSWTNTAGDVWSVSGNWNPGQPGSSDVAYFTNNQPAAYTVTFTNNPTIRQLETYNDKVTFDLQGHTLTANANSLGTPAYITNATVTFTSTGGPGTVQYVNWLPDRLYVSGAGTVVNVTNVAVSATEGALTYGATVNVLGPNARFDTSVAAPGGYSDHLGGQVNVLNGGEVTLGAYKGGGGADSTIIVTNGSSLRTNGSGLVGVGGSELIGYLYATQIKLYANSTWSTPLNLEMGYNDAMYSWARAYYGDIQLDGSTFYGQGAKIGEGFVSPGSYYLRHNGEIVLQNGSTATFSNGWIQISNFSYSQFGILSTNRLVLANSTIHLGDTTHSGAITNYGLLQASGTITGHGPGNFLLLNGNISGTGGVFNVGNSIGTLTLNRGNLQLAAGSRTYWEISDTGVDSILARDGFASVLGSNIWTWLGPAPVHGVKYGLGTYDFLVASNITWNPQYDNLVNILTNTYHLTYGVDFVYGVHNLGGGLFALELAFVPEPSTVMLLALGGLMVWRRAAKVGRDRRARR